VEFEIKWPKTLLIFPNFPETRIIPKRYPPPSLLFLKTRKEVVKMVL
jgi:hypothetical protein